MDCVMCSSVKMTPPPVKSHKEKREESETFSDSKRLDAIESGKLKEVFDELRKIKNLKLMTSRQRAMYERGEDKEPSAGGEILMSIAIPTGCEDKVITAEAIHKAPLKSQKRKQLTVEKREDKKKTMVREQDTKTEKLTKAKGVKDLQPMITYSNTVDYFFYLLFKCMPQLELHRMLNVCPLFKAIGLHPMYRKTVEVNNQFSTEELCEYLKPVNFRIKELTITNRRNCDIGLKHVYKYNKSVVGDCRGKPMTNFIKAEVIVGMFKKLPNLQKLNRKGISLNSTKFFEIVSKNESEIKKNWQTVIN